jgi:hypothetical protein
MRTRSKDFTKGALWAVVFVFLLGLPLTILFQGGCLMLLWNWFAPAPFTAIHFGAACGLDTLVGLLNSPRQTPDNDKDETFWSVFGNWFGRAIALPGFTTLVGFFIHQFFQ